MPSFFFFLIKFLAGPPTETCSYALCRLQFLSGLCLPWKQELVNMNPTQKDYLNYDEENPLPVYPLKKLNGVKSLRKQNILNRIRMKMNGLMFGRINLVWQLGTRNWHVLLFCEYFMSSPKKWYIYDIYSKLG